MAIRLSRLARRALFPFVFLAYLLFSSLTLHTRNIVQTSTLSLPYTGGAIDNIRVLRCYKWYSSCNQIVLQTESSMPSSSSAGYQIWHKIHKDLDLRGRTPAKEHSLLSWTPYNDYLYVHHPPRTRFNAPSTVITDIALGEPRSTDPPYYTIKDPQLGSERHTGGTNWHLQDKENGIWVKYEKSSSSRAITNLQIFFGNDVVDTRKDWSLLGGKLLTHNSKIPIRLSIRRGSEEKDILKNTPILKEVDDEFKVLQVSDLHFNSDYGRCEEEDLPNHLAHSSCKADQKTLHFLNEVISIEKPNLAVLTGDILDGSKVLDYQTAILKAASPFIANNIPFAIALSQQDIPQGSSFKEVVNFINSLPLSMTARFGATTPDYYHNTIMGDPFAYALKVYDNNNNKVSSAIYILGPYSSKLNHSQSDFLKKAHSSFEQKPKLSLEFQHYPIQEYRPKDSFQIVGTYNEKDKLKFQTDPNTRKTLAEIGVNAMSVGSEHTNECCIHSEGSESNGGPLWMCYAGIAGEAGYGTSFERRVRIFSINTKANEIKSWKRKESDPKQAQDYQFIFN